MHVDKWKLVHTEPGLESFNVPEKENPPVAPTDLDGVRPRRIIRKPRHLTDDYVFNLISASSNRNLLSCHLCGHPPFSSRRLWKGHLYVVHGISSALAVSGSSSVASDVDPGHVSGAPVSKSSQPAKNSSMCEGMPGKTSSAYEDISDEEASAGREAVVCRISCQESGSKVLEDAEEVVEVDGTLVLDEELKERELSIVWTLLTKIKKKNQTFLTASMVREMKELYPELSAERINALFTWTVWMHEHSSKNRSENSLVPVVQVECGDSVAMTFGGEKAVSPLPAIISDVELISSRDPVLPTVDCSPVEQESLQAIHAPAMAESEEANPSVERSGEDVGSGLADMFPELYRADEDDFDFGD